MTPKEIIENKIAKKLVDEPEKTSDIKAVVALEISGGGGGRWVLDFTSSPAKVSMDANKAADTTVKTDANTFVDLVEGKLNPQMAFLSGKVKVDGNLGIAIKLGGIFG